MDLSELQREAHAIAKGKGMNIAEAAYACKVRDCSEEQTWPADEMFWWPGDARHERGWYCWDCTKAVVLDMLDLVRLDKHLEGRAKLWPGVPIVSEPSEVPAPLYPCGGYCERVYRLEALQWNDQAEAYHCEYCLDNWRANDEPS